MTGNDCCNMTITGFCASCAGRRGLYVTGALSLAGCLCLLLPSVYCMVQEEGWTRVREWINSWLEGNQWDVEVTQSVWKGLDWMDHHHRFILAGLIAASSIHLLSTLLLILGTMLSKRSLLIPWIISDLAIIILMVFLFISWTFLSFFVDLLIAIVSPVVAGLLLGLWVVLWRNALRVYRQQWTKERKLQELQDTDYSTLGKPQDHTRTS